MRPPRIAILVLFFSASLFLFCRSVTSLAYSRGGSSTPVVATAASHAGGGPGAAAAAAAASAGRSSRFRFFSFSAPFTLFPPNAVITLTDDNSTSFPARPAAFGPPLPVKGLSGQLWIGSGFAGSALGAADGGDGGDGELGCSDVAGWDDGIGASTAAGAAALRLSNKAIKKPGLKAAAGSPSEKVRNQRRADGLLRGSGSGLDAADPRGPATHASSSPVDDGTDDYLHQSFQPSPKAHHESLTASGSSHADIQSIQEAAEIAGKIVLLSRGGCGFLEKVKWAQRRGAIALIVGDNQRGGPLIQMFARGDTSNVTIPSVFTSRTTAHILSGLMQPGSYIEDTIDEKGNAALKVQQADKSRKNKKPKQATATATMAAPRATMADRTVKSSVTKKTAAGPDAQRAASSDGQGWLGSMFHRGGADKKSPAAPRQMTDDNFVIGVHDWRDPDLVGPDPVIDEKSRSGSGKAKEQDSGTLKGGSITPSSGEYPALPKDALVGAAGGNRDGAGSSSGGLISKIFGDDDGADFSQAEPPSPNPTGGIPVMEPPQLGGDPGHENREGLWVTITPTTGASPFFDTLIVLVVSPLITLTVVYVLLIVRARIRRRRWRAPKSVVERLPVRTYHTVAPSPTSNSPRRLPSPGGAPSPTTPLLQRPRSRTATGVPGESGPSNGNDLLTVNAALQQGSSGGQRSHHHHHHEKHIHHGMSSEWKKYMGRQVECVVCLEEYVDGVSRVMSLPCGHEFHAECM